MQPKLCPDLFTASKPKHDSAACDVLRRNTLHPHNVRTLPLVLICIGEKDKQQCNLERETEGIREGKKRCVGR